MTTGWPGVDRFVNTSRTVSPIPAPRPPTADAATTKAPAAIAIRDSFVLFMAAFLSACLPLSGGHLPISA
jgi:hypothetical protein